MRFNVQMGPLMIVSLTLPIFYRYHEGVRGVLLSYARVRFASGPSASGYASSDLSGVPLGRMLEENPGLHVRASADALLFRPRLGDILTGIVQAVGVGHISILIAGVFKAVLYAEDLAPWYAPDVTSWDATPRLDEALASIAASAPSSSKKRRAGGSHDGLDDSARASILATNPRRIVEGSQVCFRVKTITITASDIVQLDGSLNEHVVHLGSADSKQERRDTLEGSTRTSVPELEQSDALKVAQKSAKKSRR